MNDLPAPSPHFRTVQLRVPVLSPGLVAAVVIGLLAVGGLAWGGYHFLQTRAADKQARIEAAASARELAAREGSRLDAAEDGVRALGQSVDKGLAADASGDIDINGYLDAQGRLRTALGQVGTDLGAFAARPQAGLLTPAQRQELDALRQRADADTAQLAAYDARIQQAAQHRQKLAQAETAARAKAQAQAEARRNTISAGTTAPPPPAAPAYYDTYPYDGYPYAYPYYYGYGPSVWIGGSWGWGGHGGWHGGGHGGGHHR